MEVSIGEIVCGQHFVELNDLLREASGDQHLGFFDQLQLVLVNLEETHKTHLELLFPKTQRHNLKKHGENTSVFLRLIGEDMEQSTDSRYVAHFPKAIRVFASVQTETLGVLVDTLRLLHFVVKQFPTFLSVSVIVAGSPNATLGVTGNLAEVLGCPMEKFVLSWVCAQ